MILIEPTREYKLVPMYLINLKIPDFNISRGYVLRLSVCVCVNVIVCIKEMVVLQCPLSKLWSTYWVNVATL
jgi:hypothetical protein